MLIDPLVRRLPWASRWLWLAGGASALVLAGIAVWVMGAAGLRHSLGAVRPTAVDLRLLLTTVAESVGAALAGPLAPDWWYLASAAAALSGLLIVVRGQPTALGTLAFWGFITPTLAVPLLLLLNRPFAPRFVALALPCLAILMGLAAWQQLAGYASGPVKVAVTPGRRVPWGRWLVLAAVPLVALFGLLPQYGGFIRSDYGVAMTALRSEARPDDAIVLNGPWQDLLFRRYGEGLPPRSIIASTVPLEPEEAIGWLTRLTIAHPRLWVIDAASDAADPHGVVAAWLDENAYPRPVLPYQKALLRPYLTEHPLRPPFETRLAGEADLGSAIAEVGLERWVLEPGAEVRLRIRLAKRASPASVRLVARLRGADGVDIWHWDGALFERAGDLRYQAAVTVPRNATPGDYVLEGVLYEPSVTGAPAVIALPITLGTVRVDFSR